METAVVLTSGGINGAVTAALAKEQYEPALLHVAWGHRAADRELAAFEQLAAYLRIEKTMVAELSWMAVFGGSARTSRRMTIEDAATLEPGTPATFLLGLMPSMLNIAATWAGAIGAKRVLVGISEDHGVPGPAVSALYPDHRMEFIQAFNLMLSYAKPPQRELMVEAPLIELARPEVIRLGQRLNVPFDRTWSCYASSERPCGRCRPCMTRAAGFLRARVADPITLETSPA